MAGDRLPRPLPASEAPRAIARLLGPAAVDARITFRFVFTLLRFSKASVSVFQFRVACCRHDYYSFADGLTARFISFEYPSVASTIYFSVYQPDVESSVLPLAVFSLGFHPSTDGQGAAAESRSTRSMSSRSRRP